MIASTEVVAGASRQVVLVDALTRTQIVQYAGASGDFNPLHTDERFATQAAGHPSVFAHGMLTMGMTSRLLTDWFGAGNVVRLSARFVRIVWPGDSLTARAHVEQVSADGEVADIILTTVNQSCQTVMTGTAVVRLQR